MPKPSLREKIIVSGTKTVHERGFVCSGVREITTLARVPLGSFTNHFTSKEAFGIAVIDHYCARTQATMDATLRDMTRDPLQRLKAYFDAVIERMQAADWRYGCLIGNMSLEAPEHSEVIRKRLVDVSAELIGTFAQVMRDGQAYGQIRKDLDSHDLASFIFASWEGAMLRMKVDRSPNPIHQFTKVIFTFINP